MRAHVEMSPSEKAAFKSLNAEEREAVLDQMLDRVREDLEWLMALEAAREQPVAAEPVAAAPAPAPITRRPTLPPPVPSHARSARPTLLPPRQRTRTLIGTGPVPPRLPARVPSR